MKTIIFNDREFRPGDVESISTVHCPYVSQSDDNWQLEVIMCSGMKYTRKGNREQLDALRNDLRYAVFGIEHPDKVEQKHATADTKRSIHPHYTINTTATRARREDADRIVRDSK